MHKNVLWIAFLFLIVGFGLWFVVKAGYDLIRYYQFSAQIPTQIEKWEVKELEANKYVIIASYSYEYQGIYYQATGQIGTIYPNPWAARRGLERFETQNWQAWLNPKAPQAAVLEKTFPYKAAISAAILLGIVVYFICLGLYVGIKHEQRRQ